MSQFLHIGVGEISLSANQVEKYNKILSWEETVFLGDNFQDLQENEEVTVYLFKTRRSYYLRFATTLLTGSPVVITKELGLDLELREEYTEFAREGAEFSLEPGVVNLSTLKENSKITNSSKKWRGLPSFFCQWHGWSYAKLGPSDFKTISFNLKKDYEKQNKTRIEKTKALMEKLQKEGTKTLGFDSSKFNF